MRTLPQWYRDGIEAALLAPTAINQQFRTFSEQNTAALNAIRATVAKIRDHSKKTEEDAGIIARLGEETKQIDTIIAFVWGAWIGACFGLVFAALIRGNDNEDVFTE